MDQNNNEKETEQKIEQKTEQKPGKTPFYKKRGFRYGSVATAFTAIFIVIVVLVNIGLSVLSTRYPVSVDLTKSHSFDISSTTINYLKNIKQPITIKVFATQTEMESDSNYGTPMKIIEQFPLYNHDIQIKYYDLDRDPAAAIAYQADNVQPQDIVVSTQENGKERYKYIPASDLLVTQTDQNTGEPDVLGNQAEQEIDSALDYVTSKTLPKVILTSGHGEAQTYFENLLTNNNYEVSTINTATTKIDESASAIAIVDPQSDFSANEISAIDAFLKNGGNYGKTAFVFFDPRQAKLPKLEEYITEWGIQVNPGLIYDQTNSFDYNPEDPEATNIDSDTVGTSIPTGMGFDAYLSRPLTLLFDTKDVRTTKAVIQTQDSSRWIQKLTNNPAPSDKDPKGPFTTMALSTWSQTSSTTGIQKSNLLVSGSTEITDQSLLQAGNKSNSKVLAGIANTLMNKQASIQVDSKLNDSAQLSLTTGQRYVIIAIFIIILPLLVLFLGLLQYLRRRHL